MLLNPRFNSRLKSHLLSHLALQADFILNSSPAYGQEARSDIDSFDKLIVSAQPPRGAGCTGRVTRQASEQPERRVAERQGRSAVGRVGASVAGTP